MWRNRGKRLAEDKVEVFRYLPKSQQAAFHRWRHYERCLRVCGVYTNPYLPRQKAFDEKETGRLIDLRQRCLSHDPDR